MKKTTMRARLLATSMITGATVAALAGAAYAADSTSATDAPVIAGASSNVSAAPTSGGIATVDAAADAGAAAPSTTVGEIVVTGSRIPQPNLTSISPIASVTHQEFQLQGHTDVIDVLNNLPQNFQNNAVDFSNTGNPLSSPGGLSTADLRGIGPQRTLVLINGRRLGIGDANTGNPNPAPDLDQIPVAMIDHIEVITGGASATYGSDAIAGVVNFILKKDFEGLQIDGTIGGDQHNQHHGEVAQALEKAAAGGFVGPSALPGDRFDGANEDASVIFGANAPDGKGNVTAYFEYRNQEPVLQKNRDWSSCLFHSHRTPNSGFCTGSANSNIVVPIQGPGCTIIGGSSSCTVVGTTFEPFPQRNTSPPAYFNSNQYEYLSRADTRYLGGFEAHYDFSPQIQLYSEFNFMDDRSTARIAPSAAFFGGNPFDPLGAGGWQVNCNNPFLDATEATAIGCLGNQALKTGDFGVVGAGTLANPEGALKDVFFGRRNVEGGPRQSYYEHFNYRGVLGLRGDLGDAWHYDVYGSYYYTFLYQNNSNYLSNTRIGRALDVIDIGGTPTCASVLTGADAACMPWNIFQAGGVNNAALNYLNIAGSESGTVQEQIVEGDMTGDLGKYGVKSPWANDGIGVSFGFDWRRDELNFIPDAVVGSGDLGGGAGVGAAINAGLGVTEGYGEVRVPIIQKAPWADLLQLDGGVRYSKYTSGPAPWTYKVGLQWAPFEDIRFRGSYQRAIRAPNIIELFTPVTVTQSNNFGTTGDPCAGAAPILTLAECERTGVTAAQYGHLIQCPAIQCDVSNGGNVGLKPEQADTYSVGATFRPHWVRGLSLSVDWWQINETGFIGTIGPETIVQQCATIDQLCDLVHRAPSTGFLFGPSSLTTGGYVVNTGVNINQGLVAGVDIQGDYRLDLDDVGAKGMGSVAFALNGTYQLEAATTTPGIGKSDCAGLFGPECQTVNPRWRHTLRVTWNTPWNVLASLQWRYIGGTSLDSNSTQPALQGKHFDFFNANLPVVNYLDLSAAWRVNTILTVRGGINNILDQDPPIVSQAVSGTGTPNTYPTYDLLGREMFLSATARF